MRREHCFPDNYMSTHNMCTHMGKHETHVPYTQTTQLLLAQTDINHAFPRVILCTYRQTYYLYINLHTQTGPGVMTGFVHNARCADVLGFGKHRGVCPTRTCAHNKKSITPPHTRTRKYGLTPGTRRRAGAAVSRTVHRKALIESYRHTATAATMTTTTTNELKCIKIYTHARKCSRNAFNNPHITQNIARAPHDECNPLCNVYTRALRARVPFACLCVSLLRVHITFQMQTR